MTALEPFPTRTPTDEHTLTGTVITWAQRHPEYRPARPFTNRQDAYRHALWVGSRELGTRTPTWMRYATCVVTEYVQDVDGQPLGGDSEEGQVRAARMLHRLISANGALNALRYVAVALECGAGIGEGYEEDCLSILKYATAIGARERSKWRGVR